jgi:hypothetical protein
MVCGIDASLAMYNKVWTVENAVNWKDPMQGLDWECLSIFHMFEEWMDMV